MEILFQLIQNLQPQAEAFRQEVAAKFGITNIGGYRAGDPDDHGKGLAVDVMVPTNSELGDQVAQYAIDNMGPCRYLIYYLETTILICQ